jgi:hypothetical protein
MSTQRSRASTSLGNKINQIESKAEKAQNSSPALPENSVNNVNIAPDSITNESIAPGSVSDESLANGAVGTQNLGVINQINSDSSLILSVQKNIVLRGSQYDYTGPVYGGGTRIIRPTGVDYNGNLVASLDASTVRVGYMDYNWTNGPIGVRFDPSTATPIDGYYRWQTGFDPIEQLRSRGNIVFLMRDPADPYGRDFIIIGGADSQSQISFNRWLSSFTTAHSSLIPYSGWDARSFTKSSSGIVLLKGLLGVSSAGASGTLLTLPDGFRPAVRMDFPFLWSSGDGTVRNNILSVFPDGRVTSNVSISSTGSGWFSLDNIRFPEASVGTWTTVGASGSGTSFTSVATDPNSSEYGPAQYWKDSDECVWWRGQVRLASAVSTDRTLLINLPTSLAPSTQLHMLSTSQSNGVGFIFGADTTGIVWKSGTSSPTSVGSIINLSSTMYAGSSLSTSAWRIPSSYSNGWVNPTGNSQGGMYQRPSDGLILVRGFLTSGTMNTPVWVHSSQGRNVGNLRATASSGLVGRVDMAQKNITPSSPSTNGWVSLDGIIYSPETA